MDKSPASGAGDLLAPDTLFDRIVAWGNIIAAWQEARKGKRQSAEVRLFEADLEANLVSLHEHLLRGTWRPGGALTSHLLANAMLDPLDHYIKDDLGVRGYVRYMDDFVLIAHDKHAAQRLLAQIDGFVSAMDLVLNPKSGIWPLKRGCTFCGYRALPTHVAVTQAAKRRWRHRLRTTAYEYRRGRINLSRCRETVLAMTAVFKHARAARSQAAMLRSFTL